MTTRLVTFLGLGRYSEVTYRHGTSVASRSPLVMRALCELFDPVDTVVVLGTPEVRAQRHETGFIAEHLGRPYHFVEIKKGQDERERWELFEHLCGALDRAPLVGAGERDAPDRILFDVTHGFRTQPLFAMAVLSYVQSEWARDGAEKAPEVRVLYGAYDPQNPPPPGEPADIWDLTQQLTVSRWNRALDGLQRYGRADDLAVIAKEATRALTARAQREGEQGVALRRYKIVERFGSVAQRFADDLALARFRDVLVREYAARGGRRVAGSAAALVEFLRSEEAQGLCEEVPVLRGSMERLARWVEPLPVERLGGEDGVRALARLAELYGRLERYSEQVAALREGLVLRYAIETGRAMPREPGEDGYNAGYAPIERELGGVSHEATRLKRARVASAEAYETALGRAGRGSSLSLHEVVRLFSDVHGPRNDVHHGGLRDEPVDAASLRKTFAEQTRRFVEASASPAQVAPSRSDAGASS